jgi:hypothetical protein
MKIYKTQQEVENDIKNDVLTISGDVRFECSISIEASIIVNAGNINAGNIDAWNINAWNIIYYAFCSVINSIKCFSIKAERGKHAKPICLDGKLEIKPEENKDEVKKAIEVLEKNHKLKDGKIIIN